MDSTSAGDSGKRLALVNGRTSALDGWTDTACVGDDGRSRCAGSGRTDGFGGSSERFPRNLIRGERDSDTAAAVASGVAADDTEVSVCGDSLVDPPLGGSVSSSVKSGLPTSTFSSS